MSRDQRPRRDVMVDSAPNIPDSTGDVTKGEGAPVAARPIATRPRLLFPAMLFLLACAAGATGVALMPLGGL